GPDNEDRSDQRHSGRYPSPAKNHALRLRFAFATQSRSQTSFEICGRLKSESGIAYSRPQTPNPFGGLRAYVAILKVLFDFHALHEVQLTVEIAVNQFACFLATQCFHA